MKKVFLALAMLCMTVFASAQGSFDIQVSPQNMKFFAEFFHAGENYNAYSYNEVQSHTWNMLDSIGGNPSNIQSLNYIEYRLFDNFYIHPEVRFNTAFTNSYYIGIAYRIPIKAMDIYIVPMYRRNGDKGGTNEFQLSINTSADWEYFYYQGYIDMYTNQKHWGCKDNVVAFTEQRFYWKAYNGLQLGVNITATTDPEFMPKAEWYINPYLAVRYAF